MEDINREGLYSIGDISKIVKISKDALRYYDDINLIKPAVTSKQTGYRYYSDDQAATILKILELKQYGFSLNEIKEIIAFGDEPIINIYKSRYFELLQEKNKLQEAINKLSLKIKQNEETDHMSKSILLVDDAAFMRSICRDIMQKHNYQVVGEAENGINGVEKYKSLNPDMVILDIVMPEMHGIDALKNIKEYNSGAKAVMCSAMAQPIMVIDSLLADASGFVVKPFQADTLIEAVNRAFTEERTFNLEKLEKLRDKLASNTEILSQREIDDIINYASTCEASDSEFEEVISKYGTTFKTKPQENDDTTEIKILRALDKLVQVQEELKDLMKQAVNYPPPKEAGA